jgi:hypothetical protein
MRLPLHLLLACALPAVAFAQTANQDPQGAALVSVFQRDNGRLVCPPGANLGLTEMKSHFAPFAEGIPVDASGSYPLLAKAVYAAFPCPFSPKRAELAPASKEDLAGAWTMPPASVRLRFPPRSPEWQAAPGVPDIKCEGVLVEPTGEYRVMQVRGEGACPTAGSLAAMKQLPRVSTWEFLPNGRMRITRSDAPSHVEEWEVHVVRSPFTFASVNFAPGDLVAYLRHVPGNNLGAATAFRHLQRAS